MHQTPCTSCSAHFGRRRASAAAFVSLLALVAACGDGSPTGPGSGSLTEATAQVAQQQAQIQSALETPVLFSFLGETDDDGFPFPGTVSSLAASRPEALLARSRDRVAASLSITRHAGAPAPSLARAPMPRMAAAASSDLGMEAFVDPELWGRTFVRTTDGTYEEDETATGAPARGVRVMLYQRLASGDFSRTVVGYADLIDSTTSTMQVGRVNLYDNQKAAMGSLRLTETETTSGSIVRWTSTLTGTLGAAGRQFHFTDTMRQSFDDDMFGVSDMEISLETRVPFANVRVAMTAASDDTQFDFNAEVETGGRTFRLEGASEMDGDEPELGSMKVFLDGRLSAVIDPTSGELRSPSGGAVSPDLMLFGHAALGVMARTPTGMDVSSAIFDLLGWLWFW